MRYYKITDDCGWAHCIAVSDTVDANLCANIRSASEITRSDYLHEEANRHGIERSQGVFDAVPARCQADCCGV